MNRKTFLLIIMTAVYFAAAAQQGGGLPIREWPDSSRSPFVLYVSGDGGFNSFSTTLCDALNKHGYAVTAINSKTYFWDKKTPEQTAAAFSGYLEKKLANRAGKQFVLVGYSFGSDIMPFVVNRMPEALKAGLAGVVLISPSTSTDFEIHWSDMFGGNTKRSMDVVAEMNKMNVLWTTTFFGAEEGNFPVRDIQLKNYHNRTLPGGHRFDGHTGELAAAILNEFK